MVLNETKLDKKMPKNLFDIKITNLKEKIEIGREVELHFTLEIV